MHALYLCQKNFALFVLTTLLWIFALGVPSTHAETEAPGNQERQEATQSGATPSSLELGVGIGVASREFSILRSFQSDSPKIRSLRIFPDRFMRLSGQAHPFPSLSGLGVHAYYDLYLAKTESAGIDGASVMSKANTWQASLRYRHRIGDLEIVAEMGVARQSHQFTEGDMELLVELPSVSYLAQRIAVQASHRLTNSLVLTLGLNKLGLIEVGPLTDRLLDAETSNNSLVFSRLVVTGSGAKLGLQYQLKSDMRVALGYTISRYSHEYTLSQSLDTVSATDDFRQLVLGLVVVR